MEKEIQRELGRVSALKLERFNEETRLCEVCFVPQFEVVIYDPYTGDVWGSNFVGFSNPKTKSTFVEFVDETDALIYAVKHRNEIRL